MSRFRAVVLGLALVSGAQAGLRAAETDRLVRTLILHPGQSITIEGTVGEITVQGSDRTDVAVDITRTAPTRALLDRLPIVLSDEKGADLRISVVQPDEEKNPKLRATIAVSVPKSASLGRVQLFEGPVSLKNLSGTLSGFVNRGPIHAARLEGSVRLETTIGPIDLDQATLSPAGLLRLRTFNGNVRLALAARPPDARILALTLNGRITSDIPLEYKDQFGPRFGGAILGKGEPVISIDVVTGDIRIEVGSR